MVIGCDTFRSFSLVVSGRVGCPDVSSVELPGRDCWERFLRGVPRIIQESQTEGRTLDPPVGVGVQGSRIVPDRISSTDLVKELTFFFS